MKEKINFKYNDGGRTSAGYKGDTGDCVVRAICIVSELPYQKIFTGVMVVTLNIRCLYK